MKTTIKNVTNIMKRKWFSVFRADFTNKDGKHSSWEFVSRREFPLCSQPINRRADAVVIVPICGVGQNAKIVMTKEFRVPLGDYEYGFPAGLVENGESIEETIKRELLEETGLIFEKILMQSPPIYSSAGLTDESVIVATVGCHGEPSTEGNEASEDIEVIMKTAPETSEMLKDKSLKFGAKAWLTLTLLIACRNLAGRKSALDSQFMN